MREVTKAVYTAKRTGAVHRGVSASPTVQYGMVYTSEIRNYSMEYKYAKRLLVTRLK